MSDTDLVSQESFNKIVQSLFEIGNFVVHLRVNSKQYKAIIEEWTGMALDRITFGALHEGRNGDRFEKQGETRLMLITDFGSMSVSIDDAIESGMKLSVN